MIVRSLFVRSLFVALAILVFSPGQAWSTEPRMHNMAGMAYLYSGKDREAFNEFVSSLKIDPNQAQPRFQLGRIFEKQRKYDLAIKQYQAALAIDPEFPGAADAARRLGFYVGPRSKDPVAPDEVVALQDYGRQLAGIQALIAQKRWDEALSVVSSLVGKRPTDGTLHLLAGQIHDGRRDLIRAVESYRNAKKYLPHSAALASALASDLYAQGSFAEADQEAREALAIDPRNERLFRLLGQIALARRDKPEAYRYLSEAARLNPQDGRLKSKADDLASELRVGHFNAGMYYFDQAQNWQRAKEEFVAALKYESLSPEDSSQAQVRLMLAEFNLSEVRKKIAEIQKEKAAREFGYLDKTLSFDEVTRSPTRWKEGRQVDFKGWIVSVENRPAGADLVVTTDQNDRFTTDEGDQRGRRLDSVEVVTGYTGPNKGGYTHLLRSTGAGFRANAEMSRWFTCRTPKSLPSDPRIRPNSQIRVLGKLQEPTFIQNIYSRTFSRYPQPVIFATQIEISREARITEPIQRGETRVGSGVAGGRQGFDRSGYPAHPFVDTPPGVAGPLKIDFLTMDNVSGRLR